MAFFFSFQIDAQVVVEETENIDIEITYAKKLGTTKAIRDLVPAPAADPVKRALVKANKKGAPVNFLNRRAYEPVNENALPSLDQDDALWQKGFNLDSKSPPVVVEPKVNIQGISNGSAPHDPSGDIGRDYYLEAINATTLAVYDKEGSLIQQFNANTIWNSIGFSSAGDPIIMYDQEEDRWLITEFPFGNQLLVAISDDSDPLGAWTAYNFATPGFPDYPKYGIWNNAYTVTTNEQGGGTLPVYLIDRRAMLNGDDDVKIIRTTIAGIGSGPGFQLATPVDWSGLNQPKEEKPIFLTLRDDAWSANAEDAVQIHEYTVDFDLEVASKTTTTVNPSPFDTNPCSVFTGGFSCMPQAGNGGGLDGIPEVIMHQAHYRNFGSHESMVFNFLVDVTAGQDLGGIRWIELRRIGNGNWEIFQEGTFAPDDGKDRFMGAICMDGSGNIGLAYAIASPDTYISLGFTGRRASDPLGEMTVEEYVLVEGTNTINSGARFGDYFHMSIDPVDDRTFWFVGEYAGGGNVRTRVAAFELSRDTVDLAPTALITPQSSPDLTANETVSIRVENFGIDPLINFNIGYIFGDNEPVYGPSVGNILLSGDTFEYTFQETVDMSVVGNYDLKIFTQYDEDLAILNDTLRVVVTKQARYDAGISNIIQSSNFVCGSTSTEVEVVLTNFGTEPLTSAIIEVEVNGVLQDDFIWEGNLAPGDSENISVTVGNLMEGDNAVICSADSPSFETDERPENNAFSTTIEVVESGQLVIFEIRTDFYPTETTWQLEDENGSVLYTGGPYDSTETIYTEEWCLDVDACYSFNIQDAYSDGICCGFGQGYYNIIDANGDVLFAGDGNFGAQTSDAFCTEYQCLLSADFDAIQESTDGAADGTLMITTANGVGPFSYSIDNGVTYQDSNIFTGLSAGAYQVIIEDDFGCEFTALTEITTCTLTISATVTNESFPGANDGMISFGVIGGTPPYLFSIDGGATFSNDLAYELLENGSYEVVVKDAADCERVEAVEIIELNTSNDNISVYGQTIEVFPNPTDDVVTINLDGFESADVMLDFEVFDISGKRIQIGRLVRYNETYKGQISLVSYPSGVYFVRFEDKEISQLLRLVKN